MTVRTKWTTERAGLPLALFGAMALVLFAVVALFARDDLPPPTTSPDYGGPSALEGWYRFDGVWYRSIAADGYFFRGDEAQSSVAFFPVYPLVMRALQSVFGGDAAAWGVFITLLSGLTVAVCFYRWCVPRVGETSARYALAVLLLWPYGWYLYGAVYADALFIALVIGAFTLLERDRIVLATALGAIATATRPVGVAVVVGLFVRQLERDGVFSLPRLDRGRGRGRLAERTPTPQEGRPRLIRVDPSRLRARNALPLLSIAGLVCYVIYQAVEFGEPFAFALAERAPGWELNPGPRTWFKVSFFERVQNLPEGVVYTNALAVQAVFAIGLLMLTLRVGRSFGWGYAAYLAVVLAIPLLSSKDFQGIGRYCLSAFPAFAVLGQFLAKRQQLANVVLTASAAILVVLCGWYSRGRYLA